jgi:hypothetical protein
MAPHLMPRRDDEDEEEEKPQGETAEEDNGIKS